MDVTAIRDDARRQVEQGALTSGNTTEVERVIDVINQVVATEMVCVMRYTQNAIAASGIDRAQVAAEFTEHATRRFSTGLRAAERIVITTCQEMVRWIGNSDPATRRLIEDILAEEEDHADDLNDLLGN
ncbi:bacterioferritin [Rhodococcus hoagii]|nr:bacterioferritin [Prescottella equi]